MTAINIIKRRDEIVIVTDGAGYSEAGVLLFAAPKVDLLPHFSGFVAHSGGTAWTPAIVTMFGHLARSLDDLFDQAANILVEVERKFEGISNKPMGRVIFGGWSDEKQQMRLGVVFSAEAAELDQDGGSAQVIQPDAFTLQELDGDALLCQPQFGERAWLQGWGSRISDLSQITDVDAFASFLLTAQREIGAPARGVGAFGQITRITKEECTTRIFERYPDEIGEVMEPIPVNWPAWRAARARKAVAVAGVPSSLSRLQRERMVKKAKKATLRSCADDGTRTI